MFEINGKYASAKVFADTAEASAIGQITALCDQPFAENSRIRIMPDVHAGKGCSIGTTMTVTDKIVPNLVGVDIGCGMETVKLKEKRVDLPKLDDFQEYIALYFSEKDEKYLDWFLHYYEPRLNTIIMQTVQEYAMPGHFADLKQTYLFGIWKALQKNELSPASRSSFSRSFM